MLLAADTTRPRAAPARDPTALAPRIPSRVAQVVPESPPPRFPTGLILSEDRWLQLSGFNKNRSVPKLAGSPLGPGQRREGKRENERPEGTDPRRDPRAPRWLSRFTRVLFSEEARSLSGLFPGPPAARSSSLGG